MTIQLQPGWTEWDGRPWGVPNDIRVSVRRRDGFEVFGEARRFRFAWPAGSENPRDVVAFSPDLRDWRAILDAIFK